MSKFKVGDKVKCTHSSGGANFIPGHIYKVTNTLNQPAIASEANGRLIPMAVMCDLYHWYDFERVALPVTVITTDGTTTTAIKREGKTILATAKAICSPADTFDADYGAQLAFERLMCTEGKKKPEPKPEYSQERFDQATKICLMGTCSSSGSGRKHDCPFKGTLGGCSKYAATHPETQKLMDDYLAAEAEPEKPTARFKVGDRVWDVNEKSYATIIRVDEKDDAVPYKVKYADGNTNWRCKQNVVPCGPDAEPPKPKYYTGKMVCIKSGYPWWTVGKVYDIMDGTITANDGAKYSGYISAEDARHAGRTIGGAPFPGSDAGHNPNNEFIPFVEE